MYNSLFYYHDRIIYYYLLFQDPQVTNPPYLAGYYLNIHGFVGIIFKNHVTHIDNILWYDIVKSKKRGNDMPTPGSTFTIRLKPSHLGWGNYRYTNSRDIIYGEGYIPIPKRYALAYSIFNSNHSPNGLGINLYHASSTDGFLNNVSLLAQGCKEAGDIYAKQFSVKGNLRIIGSWYANQHATTANSVKVTWTSPVDIILEIV